jgi:hypothetical protein
MALTLITRWIFFDISSEYTLTFGKDFNAFDAGDGKAEVS